MIDLGNELAGYGEQPQTPSKPPEGMGSVGRLADLQAGGFNVDPRRADADPQQWGFSRGLGLLSGKVVGGGGAGKAGAPGGGGDGLNVPWLTRIARGAAGASTFTPANQDGFQPVGSFSEDDPPEIELKTWLSGDDDD